ncbi:unnamed protein product [Bursaphelenchus okinawaensis]|uniref:GBD/FH3 domain-containing protein n=1 Tax=Bursaphelenchus okinawaensis TaxID=465554 RepID=A0A811JW80_9BILA|nr:unnamed protein product [Bursaphelenchus okinawaensis]CAG9085820.1 unnamed protein product [Bursaphelenchus okinawaensis]
MALKCYDIDIDNIDEPINGSRRGYGLINSYPTPKPIKADFNNNGSNKAYSDIKNSSSKAYDRTKNVIKTYDSTKPTTKTYNSTKSPFEDSAKNLYGHSTSNTYEDGTNNAYGRPMVQKDGFIQRYDNSKILLGSRRDLNLSPKAMLPNNRGPIISTVLTKPTASAKTRPLSVYSHCSAGNSSSSSPNSSNEDSPYTSSQGSATYTPVFSTKSNTNILDNKMTKLTKATSLYDSKPTQPIRYCGTDAIVDHDDVYNISYTRNRSFKKDVKVDERDKIGVQKSLGNQKSSYELQNSSQSSPYKAKSFKFEDATASYGPQFISRGSTESNQDNSFSANFNGDSATFNKASSSFSGTLPHLINRGSTESNQDKTSSASSNRTSATFNGASTTLKGTSATSNGTLSHNINAGSTESNQDKSFSATFNGASITYGSSTTSNVAPGSTESHQDKTYSANFNRMPTTLNRTLPSLTPTISPKLNGTNGTKNCDKKLTKSTSNLVEESTPSWPFSKAKFLSSHLNLSSNLASNQSTTSKKSFSTLPRLDSTSKDNFSSFASDSSILRAQEKPRKSWYQSNSDNLKEDSNNLREDSGQNSTKNQLPLDQYKPIASYSASSTLSPIPPNGKDEYKPSNTYTKPKTLTYKPQFLKEDLYKSKWSNANTKTDISTDSTSLFTLPKPISFTDSLSSTSSKASKASYKGHNDDITLKNDGFSFKNDGLLPKKYDISPKNEGSMTKNDDYFSSKSIFSTGKAPNLSKINSKNDNDNNNNQEQQNQYIPVDFSKNSLEKRPSFAQSSLKEASTIFNMSPLTSLSSYTSKFLTKPLKTKQCNSKQKDDVTSAGYGSLNKSYDSVFDDMVGKRYGCKNDDKANDSDKILNSNDGIDVEETCSSHNSHDDLSSSASKGVNDSQNKSKAKDDVNNNITKFSKTFSSNTMADSIVKLKNNEATGLTKLQKKIESSTNRLARRKSSCKCGGDRQEHQRWRKENCRFLETKPVDNKNSAVSRTNSTIGTMKMNIGTDGSLSTKLSTKKEEVVRLPVKDQNSASFLSKTTSSTNLLTGNGNCIKDMISGDKIDAMTTSSCSDKSCESEKKEEILPGIEMDVDDIEEELRMQEEHDAQEEERLRSSLVLRQKPELRVKAIIEKLLYMSGRDQRRALFSLKQIFQDDKDLVHEFVQNEGLDCLIKLGRESDQTHQNHILRALGQLMLYVDGMNGIIAHSGTICWLYELLESPYRLVVKTALKLLLVFVEYTESNALLLMSALSKVEKAKGKPEWSSLMKILCDKKASDVETQILGMTVVNKTLNGIPDQDTFFDVVDCLENLGLEEALKQMYSLKDPQLTQQCQHYEHEVRKEDAAVQSDDSDPQLIRMRNGTSVINSQPSTAAAHTIQRAAENNVNNVQNGNNNDRRSMMRRRQQEAEELRQQQQLEKKNSFERNSDDGYSNGNSVNGSTYVQPPPPPPWRANEQNGLEPNNNNTYLQKDYEEEQRIQTTPASPHHPLYPPP